VQAKNFDFELLRLHLDFELLHQNIDFVINTQKH